MKLWEIKTVIETDDDYDPTKIINQIDQDVNRGDGIYFTLDNIKIKLLKTINDDEK